MDPLSDVLALLKVQSALSARFEGCGRWAMSFPTRQQMKFGCALEGGFWLWIEGQKSPVEIATGDFYLLTGEMTYYTATDPHCTPLDGRRIFASCRDADGVVRYGNGDNRVVVTGGKFTFDDRTSDILLKQLPPLIHLPANRLRTGALTAVMSLLASETQSAQPGAAISASSIATLVLVQLLRAYLASSDDAAGWLSAIRDRRIAAALSQMHADLAKSWKVEELAQHVGMSRTAFSQRFKTLVGLPPLDYLIRWRMAVARHELIHSEQALLTIAEKVGYGSDTAFSSAFRRITGQSPGRYRTLNRQGR